MGAFTDVMNDWDQNVGQELDDRLATGHLPKLSKLLRAPGGATLAAEIAELMGQGTDPLRANRHSIEIMGHLEADGYHRNVVIRDISSTGARLRVARTGTLDIVQSGDIRLSCRIDTEQGPEYLNVGLNLVRIVETAPRHFELAYQFCHVNDAQGTVLEHMSDFYAVH